MTTEKLIRELKQISLAATSYNSVVRQTCGEAAAELERLAARVAELEADKARLDWYESNHPELHSWKLADDQLWNYNITLNGRVTETTNIRSAIDSAMQQAK